MATTRNNDRVRYRYGICLNENCEKSKSKEVQEIPARKDFVCSNPECGKPLRECPPPKKGGNKKLIAIIAGIVALLAIVGGIFFMSGGSSKTEPANTTVAAVDSDSIKVAIAQAEQQRVKDSLQAVADSLSKVAEQAKANQAPVAAPTSAAKSAATPAPAPKPAASSGSKNLGYATFKGSWPNDVNGRMVFTSSHIIDSKDPKKRVAEAGDYVIGEWADGHLVQGIWYGSDNQVKSSVIIGK